MAGVELHFAGGLVIQSLDLAHQSLQVIGGEQIGLFDEIEDRVFRPLRILEAFVAGRRLDERFAFLALHPLGGGLPQIKIVFPEIDLSLNQLFRVFQQLVEQFLKGLADDGRVHDRKLITAFLALEEFL